MTSYHKKNIMPDRHSRSLKTLYNEKIYFISAHTNTCQPLVNCPE